MCALACTNRCFKIEHSKVAMKNARYIIIFIFLVFSIKFK